MRFLETTAPPPGPTGLRPRDSALAARERRAPSKRFEGAFGRWTTRRFGVVWSVPGCGIDVDDERWVREGDEGASRRESHLGAARGADGLGLLLLGSLLRGSGFVLWRSGTGSGGERTERCARALSDRRDRRGVSSRVAAVAGRRAPGRRATGNRKRPIGPRMPFERGMRRTAARTRRATRAFFWALAENLLLREEQWRGTARSVARSRAREGPQPGRKTYRDARIARASLVTDFPNQRVCVRETLARVRSRTYPETAARAASWGAAAQIAAIASEVGL